MDAQADVELFLSSVPLLNAVFCVDCETISNSPHDACTVCGSHSLISLFRLLGGTLRAQKGRRPGEHAKVSKYNLELIVKIHEIPANELAHAIQSINRLAEVAGNLESLHINLESVIETPAALKVA